MPTDKPLIVCIGEVLWDVLPTEKVMGGAPANVAWHAAQLGADSRIVSAVGDDAPGSEILERLRDMRMNCENIAVVTGKPTSMVEAKIDADGAATYVIHPDVAWDFISETEGALALLRRARAVNFGTLFQRTENGRRVLRNYLDAVPRGCLRLFDVNLRLSGMNNNVLEAGFSSCDIVKLNAEELFALADIFNWSGEAERILDEILDSYLNIEHVIVTHGADGAWWKTRTDLFRKPGISVNVADTIGAGDSLTAAVIMGILQNKEPRVILEAALSISSFVCTQIGATPRLPEHLQSIYGDEFVNI